MARYARKESESNIYHVVFKGINHESIFKPGREKEKVIKILKEKKVEHEIKIYAFCVMNTHIHLLIRGNIHEISKYICRCEIEFAMHYNIRMKRNGHVFQNRFYSEGINSEKHFWNCINYIHNNPVKAQMTKSPAGYSHSSYMEYYNRKPILISEKAIALINKKFETEENFTNFSSTNDLDKVFLGTEFEMKQQRRELIQKELRTLTDLSVFVNGKGHVSYSDYTKNIAKQLDVPQIEIIDEIKKNLEGKN